LTHTGEHQHAGDDNGMEQIAGDTDDVTYLAANASSDPVARATSPMGMAMPGGGSESRFVIKKLESPVTDICLRDTVNPDQLLAAYAAARARSAGEGSDPASPVGQTTSGLQPPLDSNVRQSVISDASVYSTTGPSDGSRK
jgi:PPE-repeat protein